MGNGRSKISTTIHGEFVPTDYGENGTDLDIDIDIELNEQLVKQYEDDRYNFVLDAQDVGDFLNNVFPWVNVRFDMDSFGEDGTEEVEEYVDPLTGEVTTLIHNSDLRFATFQSVSTLLKIQDKYNKITGDDESIVDSLYFDYYTQGFEDGTLGSHTHFTVDGVLTNHINLEASEEYRVNFSDIAKFRNGSLKEEPERYGDFIIHRNSFRNGWFAVAGAYQNSTIVHEIGHALYYRLFNRVSTSESTRLTKMFSDWNSRTRHDPVSGYSQKDVDEAFAECFSLYVNGGKSNSQMYREFENIIAPALGIESMFGCAR